MNEWQPQIIVGLFFSVGLLLSYLGAIVIEKGIQRIRARLQTLPSKVTEGRNQKT